MNVSKRKTMKRFINVHFIASGENDTVPRSWLSDDHTCCQWPKKGFKGNIQTMSEKELSPLSTWKFYKCRVNCYSG